MSIVLLIKNQNLKKKYEFLNKRQLLNISHLLEKSTNIERKKKKILPKPRNV